MELNDENFAQITKKITDFARRNENPERFEHSIRVAQTCRRLSEKYGVDSRRAFVAGLSHDICKDFSNEKILELAESDRLGILQIEKEKPSLLHGRAAAVILQKNFGFDFVSDRDIIEAVQNHTFGVSGMSDVAKILYVADKIEPGRDYVTENYLKKLENLTLDELVIFVLQENIAYLKKRNKTIAYQTYVFLEDMKDSISKSLGE